ncbi:MAG: hypothetical protein IJX00_02000 [Clostridia bacterium]|nr:hypothetical protein [Clostridia bacterium]
MQTSMLLGMFDWIGEFFKELFNLIPKIMYLLYASIACVIDVLQLFFRKLAGLDVYYVDGEAITGDLVTNFITGILGINAEGLTYSALSTVFWSMLIFGIIICFVSTFIAIIKSHYTYDDKAAKGPMQYVYTGVKAIINMVAAPIIIVLALFVSEALLSALDSITSTGSGSVAAMYGDAVDQLSLVDTVKGATGKAKEKTYIFYDLFGFQAGILYGPSGGPAEGTSNETKKEIAKIASKNETFSGSLFKVAAFNANRARLGQINTTGAFTGNAGSSCTLFRNAKSQEHLAEMIDMAFACNLRADKGYTLDYTPFAETGGGIVSMKYFTNFLSLRGTHFSKFNIGAVWYYYDLWQFNFIVGFAGCIVCTSIFINIILGLMTRLFMCIGLFLIASPLFGLAPMDGGKAGKSWRESFTKQVLMTYGSVVGMNLMLMILPYMNTIDFFNVTIADYFARTLLIIVGLITIKAFIGVCSSLVGGEDANKTGDGIKKEVASVAGKATSMTVGAAKLGVKGTALAARGFNQAARLGIAGGQAIGGKIAAARANAQTAKAARLTADAAHNRNGRNNFARINAARALVAGGRGSQNTARQRLMAAGYSKQTANQMIREMRREIKSGNTNAGSIASHVRTGMATSLTTGASNATSRAASLRTTSTNRLNRAKHHAGVVGTAWKPVGSAIKKGAGKAWTGVKTAVVHPIKTGKSLLSGFDKAVGQVKVGKTLGETIGFAGGALTGDDFVSGFMHDSGIKKKPDAAKETAAATQGMARQQAEQRYQAWLAANPTATDKEKKKEKAKIYGEYGLKA